MISIRHLDTSIAVRLRDGDEDIVRRIDSLDYRPALSIITRVELDGGIYAKPELTQKRLAAVAAILVTLKTIEFDSACADAYRRIVEVAGFKRRLVVDRMIAATALVHDAVLITGNGADFRDIPGLSIEEW